MSQKFVMFSLEKQPVFSVDDSRTSAHAHDDNTSPHSVNSKNRVQDNIKTDSILLENESIFSIQDYKIIATRETNSPKYSSDYIFWEKILEDDHDEINQSEDEGKAAGQECYAIGGTNRKVN
ncbi:Uncharacterized protein Fot_45468 [Forsythia ovata]|uniref:Uncharacterized protein n=1 Tax=Forsythia ovata TaxID=205694 RepID=A0ABD1R6I0_9LAMI